MTRRLAWLALLLPLAGCMLPSGGGTMYDDAYEAPLRVRLHGDLNAMGSSSRHLSQFFQVSLNQPAHVAIFELRAGQGAMMIYPSGYNRHQAMTGGSSFVNIDWFRANRFGWQQLGGMPLGGASPRYFMVVASKQPLRVDDLVSSPTALRRELGFARFATLQPFTLMDEIVNYVVPMQHDEDWATDIYVHWPMPATLNGDAREMNRLVRVACPDGRSVVIPFYAVQQGLAVCEQLRDRPQAPDTARSDSATIRRPDSRRPTTRTAQGAETPMERPAVRRAGMTERGQPEVELGQPSERERARRMGVGGEPGERSARGARAGVRPAPGAGEATSRGEASPAPSAPSPRPQRAEPRPQAPPANPAPAPAPRPAPAPSAGERRPETSRPTPPDSRIDG